MDKFQEAICAFANDLPNSKKKGYLILGAHDDGRLSGLKVTDALLKKIAGIRSDGNILPLPVMSVERFEFPDGDLLVAEVTPSELPPVRYRGRTFIRIGPRRDIATEAEERILSERRTSYMATFDAMPCLAARLTDIDTELIRNKYLEKLIGKELLAVDDRPIEEQMSAVGMYDTENNCPTNAAMVLFGKKPRRFMPGLYVQYVRFKGEDVSSEVQNEIQLDGNYCELLPRLESLLELSVIKKKPVFVSMLREEMVSNFPYTAIRELVMNGCMHRDLQSNMPLRIYEFAHHLEITNAGGLYGNARPENFPTINDYRNPLIASAMKTMGYVNMFNRGVGQVQADLKENGNPPAEFVVNLLTAFRVNVNDVEKVATISEKVATSGQKVATPDDNIAPGKKYKSAEEMAIYILEYCETWRSIDEIARFTDRDKNYIRNKVLPKLAEKLEKEFPDTPNHPKQRYRTKQKEADA
jgi:ATP-dependent DNA helicase RecG